MNTLVGLSHPFFKTNDDQPFYLREIFFEIDKSKVGEPVSNNYIVTAYQKEIG